MESLALLKSSAQALLNNLLSQLNELCLAAFTQVFLKLLKRKNKRLFLLLAQIYTEYLIFFFLSLDKLIKDMTDT